MNQLENKELLQLKAEVCAVAVKAYREKLSVGTSGNISALYEAERWMVITPSSYDYDIMKPEDIVVIDLDGNHIDGRLKPSSEWKMHAELYKQLSHVKAVVHTHSPYATSFAVLKKEIPVILIEMVPFIKGSLEVSPFAAQGSAEVGHNAVPILRRKNACLMANHGVVSVGENLGQAYINSVYAEDISKIYHMALSVGEPTVISGY